MEARTLLIVFALSWDAVVSQLPPRSPCPNVMYYDNDGREYVGVVKAENPPPLGSSFKIMVQLSIPVELPTSYVGRMALAEDQATVINNIKLGRPILYYIYFPLKSVIPRVVKITFANRVICVGPPDTGGVVTTIDLEHSLNTGSASLRPEMVPEQLRPADNYQPVQQRPVNNNFDNSYRPPQVTRPTLRPQNAYATDELTDNSVLDSIEESKEMCGTHDTISTTPSPIVPLIYNGKETFYGDWPWIVAIYTTVYPQSFICGGSIISNRHILTAGHCVVASNKQRNPKDFRIKLGAHNLNTEEASSRNMDVMEVMLHPQYDASKFGNDIAIIKLTTLITFNQYIKPVCIWNGNGNQRLIINQKGTVVGWGQNERSEYNFEFPAQLEMPIVSTDDCQDSSSTFKKWVTHKNICAGDRKNSGPCRGDSGSGLYMLQNTKWSIRGIVSFAINDNKGGCDTSQYSVFTDVAMYRDWIYSL